MGKGSAGSATPALPARPGALAGGASAALAGSGGIGLPGGLPPGSDAFTRPGNTAVSRGDSLLSGLGCGAPSAAAGLPALRPVVPPLGGSFGAGTASRLRPPLVPPGSFPAAGFAGPAVFVPPTVEGPDEAVLAVADEVGAVGPVESLRHEAAHLRPLPLEQGPLEGLVVGILGHIHGSMVLGSISVYHMQVDRVPGVG